MTRYLTAALIVAVLVSFGPAAAREPDPVLYRSAPIIPWAKKIGEHRFRSPRNYDDTLKYYRKIFAGNRYVAKEKIINTSEVRAIHYRNKRHNGRWEGFNIYEYKGSAIIYVVFSDKELKKIAEEKKNPKKKQGGRKKGK